MGKDFGKGNLEEACGESRSCITRGKGLYARAQEDPLGHDRTVIVRHCGH